MDEGQVKGFVSIANAAGGLRVFGGGAGGAGDALPVQLSGSSALDAGRVHLDLSGGAVMGFADTTGGIPVDATGFAGVVVGGSVNAWWDGGSSPTSVVGVPGLDGSPVTMVSRDDVLRFRAIKASLAPHIWGHFL